MVSTAIIIIMWPSTAATSLLLHRYVALESKTILVKLYFSQFYLEAPAGFRAANLRFF